MHVFKSQNGLPEITVQSGDFRVLSLISLKGYGNKNYFFIIGGKVENHL